MRLWLVPLLLLLSPLSANAQSCNGSCMARRAESQLLKFGLAERHGDRLVLTIGSHKFVFTDNRTACDAGNAHDCAIYALVANAPGSLAVQKFEFEGSDTTLVDTRNGKRTLLTGVPVFSPDGSEFVVTDFSNDSDNNLEIWRRDADGAKLEWAHPFRQSFTEDPALQRYPDNPALALPPVFRVTRWEGNRMTLAVSTDDQRFHWAGSLVRDEKGWHLSAKSPPGMLANR